MSLNYYDISDFMQAVDQAAVFVVEFKMWIAFCGAIALCGAALSVYLGLHSNEGANASLNPKTQSAWLASSYHQNRIRMRFKKDKGAMKSKYEQAAQHNADRVKSGGRDMMGPAFDKHDFQ